MSENDKQRLVLFDFDGTLTRIDSLFAFLRFFRGNLYFVNKLLLSLPYLVMFKLGLTDNSSAKEKLLINFLKEKSVDEFESRCKIFAQVKIPLILNEPIVKKFHEHIASGDKVIIVSASLENWIIPWARQWGVEVLASKTASAEGVLSGELNGRNCNGEEKVTRIKSHLDLADYIDILAYGDSSGDEPMLSLADHVVYRGQVRK